MLSHPMKLFSEDNCHGKPPCHASSSEAHSQNSPCLPPGKGSHTGGNITVGKTTPQHEKSSRKPNFPQDLSQGVPRLVTSEQSQARDTRSYEVMTSRCIDAIHKSSSPHSSQEKISYLPSSEKRRATGSTPSKTVTQHPTLLRTPERGSAPMRDRSHSPHGKSLRPSNHPSLPQNAAIIVRAKGYEQQEHQKTHPKPTSEPNKGGYVASASHGNKKHFASHAASGGGVSDNGFSSGVGAFRSGKHTAGKGKGRALELIGTTPFPLAWGFGRAQRRAPGSPVHQRTLLQLLSCRKLEQFKPHEYYATKMPLSAVNVTRSHDFPFGDVRGKCQHWSDFTFENMLARFPFLNRTVEVPQELGPESPGLTLFNEAQFHASLDSHLFRYIRQYLRITFADFTTETEQMGAAPVTIRDGQFMRLIKSKKPDFGVYKESIRANLETEKQPKASSQPVNRMIIEVKPSAKWDPHWWDITEDENTPLGRARGVNEDIYYSPLSQLNFYMAHSGVDYAGPIYGVLLTDQYLIPVKRDGFIYGALATGQPIPWSTYFENGQEISGFTVQSALWYLSMLSGMPGWHYRGDEALREVRNDMQVFKAHHSKQEK